MKYLIIILLILNSCTYVSNIHPELTYREHPFVEITCHENWLDLQTECFRQHKTFDIYLRCALIPINPKEVCKINIMCGDGTALIHELKHCHGYADTFNPFKAQGAENKYYTNLEGTIE